MIESLKLIHKPIFEGIPKCLNDKFTFSLNRSDIARYSRKPMMKIQPRDNKMQQSLLYRAVFLYNKLPDDFRHMNPKSFSKKIYGHILTNFSPFDIPKNEL